MRSRYPTRILPILFVLMFVGLSMSNPTSARVLELVQRQVDTSLRDVSRLTVSPDGRFVYLGGTNVDIRLQRNSATGRLTFDGAGYGVGAFSISPDGRSFYSIRSGVMRTHTRHVENGTLRQVDEWRGSPAFGVHGFPETIRLSPDGAHAYVRIHDGRAGIAIFNRNPENSVLTWVETIVDGVDGGVVPWDLTFSADGRNVYGLGRASLGTYAVVVFSRDPATGSLEQKQVFSETGVNLDAGQIRISKDGSNLYVIVSSGIMALQRNPIDGSLSFLDFLDILDPETLVVGPDDRFVYLVRKHFVVIYARRSGTGALDLVETLELPMDGLSRVKSAEFSPDGRHLYRFSRAEQLGRCLRDDAGASSEGDRRTEVPT